MAFWSSTLLVFQQSLNANPNLEMITMCGVKLSACQRENVTLTLSIEAMGHWDKNGYDCSLSLSLERTQFNFKLTT